LRQALRLEAFGRLAGGIAHDFNNVLAVIIGFAKLLLRDLAADDPRRERAEQIEQAGERAAALTRQLLAFSRRQLLTPQTLNLNDVIADVRRLLERLIGEDIRLEVVLDPDLGSVTADRGQLEQVILNLVVNARDAMPTGGRLTIKTANLDEDDSDLAGDGNHGSRAGVMLLISDTGPGMDESTRARAFDPFFTTKETGKGTGLGLATVYGIVTQSRGSIRIDSTPGHGTTFTIQLPRTDSSELSATGSAEASEESLEGSETILLVEDDDGVRAFVKDVLERHGYRVLVAALPSEAIAIAAGYAGEIELILTDVVMPEVSGRELCETLTASRPMMRTLYMSGYTAEALGHHGVLDEGIALIEKPFTPTALARKLREILEGDKNNMIGHEPGRDQA
jgi:two-component system cell cycle sensor histidine kinase/response regulator CckA